MANGQVRYRVYVKRLRWWAAWDYLVYDYTNVECARTQIQAQIENDNKEYDKQQFLKERTKASRQLRRDTRIIKSETIE